MYFWESRHSFFSHLRHVLMTDISEDAGNHPWKFISFSMSHRVIGFDFDQKKSFFKSCLWYQCVEKCITRSLPIRFDIIRSHRGQSMLLNGIIFHGWFMYSKYIRTCRKISQPFPVGWCILTNIGWLESDRGVFRELRENTMDCRWSKNSLGELADCIHAIITKVTNHCSIEIAPSDSTWFILK